MESFKDIYRSSYISSCIAGLIKRMISKCSLKYIITAVMFFSILISGCGSEFKTLFDETADAPPLDTGKTVVYWSESSNTINGINTDKSGETTLISTPYTPLDIAIDTAGKRIFWTENTGTDYRISRAGIDGTGSSVVYSTSSTDFGPSAISIDNSNGIIYWNEYQVTGLSNNIWRSEISSDSLSKVKWLNDLASYYTYASCVDGVNGRIYFTVNSYYDIGTPAGSSNSGDAYMGDTSASDSEQQKVSLTGPSDPSVPFKGITVDSTGGYVYYVTNTPHGVWPKNITRADLSLGGSTTWIYLGVADIQKIALDLEERKIYWTSESDNSIYRADLDAPDSNMEKFLQLDSKPTGIAISQ